MKSLLERRDPPSEEELTRLEAYDRLDAISDFVGICVVVALWSFLSAARFRDPEIYGLCAAMGLLSVLWHALIPIRRWGIPKLVINSLLKALFATLIIRATGYDQSPFFFLYYLVLLGAALEIGVGGAVFLSGLISLLYAAVVLTAPYAVVQDFTRSLPVWSNVASIWVVGWIAALTAHEADKVRKSIEHAKDRIEAFAKIDWLTGVYNRRHFDGLAQQELARAERYQRPLSLLIIDSDHLKAVNDRLGHQVGDQLLRELAAVITQQCRGSDTVIRYGGDEFVVLLPETDAFGAAFLGERIRVSVEEYAQAVPDGQELRTTVSVGVASFPDHAADERQLLYRADSALYRSKELGRNRTTTYSDELPEQAPDGALVSRGAPPLIAPVSPGSESGLHTA
jgi:diguanylate cyclase (GGDEF)-like protein